MPMPPPDDIEYLDLADDLLLAGAALDRATEVVFDVADLGLAESALHAPAATSGGVEFYPDLVSKARVLVIHLAKNHPPPDGNKRAAYLA
jgi:death-on-curing protein